MGRMTVDTAAVRRRMGAISIFRRATDDHATITRGASVVTEIVQETVPALCDALDEERERVRVLQTYLWRIRDAVMHEGGWCYDYETAEGQRIAEAVHVIWREARDAGLHPFATAGGEGQERVLTRRETLEVAIRALGYAVPFTYGNPEQAARLTASVHADYLHAHGVDLPLAEIRDACGFPSAAEEGVTP